jgi:CHAD domain-containing protein/adenylate cyclase class IV
VTETARPAGRDKPAARPVEFELKYRVLDLPAAERYLAAATIGPFIGASQARSTQMEDRYVDTADRAMERAGFAVRLRSSGSGVVVSVKSRTKREGPGGSFGREELEGPADRTAGPADWPASDARSLVMELCGDAPLVEVVTIRQLRRKRQLRDGATRVELSLDEVDVVASKRVVGRFIELEAELVKGDEALLAGLATAFGGDPALSQASESKLDAAMSAVRGAASENGGRARSKDRSDDADEEAEVAAEGEAALLDDSETSEDLHDADDAEAGDLAHADHHPTTSDDVDEDLAGAPSADAPRLSISKTAGVTGDDHVAEAGRKVMRFHLARMLAREAGTRADKDHTELHAMRVATRRQRAAWRVFGTSFRAARTKRFRTGLRETAARLGAVRDLDVLLEAADLYRADLPVTEQRALEPLLADWRAHREDALVLLIRELDSDGYHRWVDDYRDFVRTEGAGVLPVGPVDPHRVRDTAPSHIWAAYEQVRAYEPVLRWADVETLHDLRIAGKWLRYTLEFVREALGPESAPLIARVTALQDHLGLMHDADVAASMSRAFLVEHAGDLSPLEGAAIGRYLINREREVARLKRTIGGPWRGVAGVGFRRALGRVVAGL